MAKCWMDAAMVVQPPYALSSAAARVLTSQFHGVATMACLLARHGERSRRPSMGLLCVKGFCPLVSARTPGGHTDGRARHQQNSAFVPGPVGRRVVKQVGIQTPWHWTAISEAQKRTIRSEMTARRAGSQSMLSPASQAVGL